MAEITKTKLRRRWSDPDFIRELSIPTDRAPENTELQNLDLRGVPKLASGDPLWHFRIHEARAEKIDFSYGSGCLLTFGSTLRGLTFCEFKFDRASRLTASTFEQCDFQKARLRLDSTDSEFEGCRFDDSTFAGGMSEYGFRRCTFRHCSFQRMNWKGTYFRACSFIHCDFSECEIRDSVVAGFKHFQCNGFSPDIFVDCSLQSVMELDSESV